MSRLFFLVVCKIKVRNAVIKCRIAHLDRLGAIACFKETVMTIAKLQTLFHYEKNESEHITDILALLEEQRVSVWKQLQTLKKDYAHICRKLGYYQGIHTAMLNDAPAPNWDTYKDCTFEIQPRSMVTTVR